MAGKQPSLNQKVRAFAQNHLGQTVETGECWDLPEAALEAAGANTAYAYQEITEKKDQNYIWGKLIDVKVVQPGDILQFRDHTMLIITRIKGTLTLPDTSTIPWKTEQKRPLSRPQHSAIVSSNRGKGVLMVFEQHVNTPGKKMDTVQENLIYVSSQPEGKSTARKPYTLDFGKSGDLQRLYGFFPSAKEKIDQLAKEFPKGKVKMVETRRTVEVKVSGRIWAYRSEPR